MAWKEFIAANTEVLGGKPVVKGIRLSVEFLLGLLAQGWTGDQLRVSYPQLSDDALRAVFAYAADALHDEILVPIRQNV